MYNPLVQFTRLVIEGTVKTSKAFVVKYSSVEGFSDFLLYVPSVDAEPIEVKETAGEIRKTLDEKYESDPGAAE